MSPPLRAVLTGEAWGALCAESEARYPHEACGILLGRAGARAEVLQACPVPNADRERAGDRYLLDPSAQLAVEREARLGGLDVLGYFHSHPDHPALASPTDLERSWEDVLYLIVSVRAGRVTEARCWFRPLGASAFQAVSFDPPQS